LQQNRIDLFRLFIVRDMPATLHGAKLEVRDFFFQDSTMTEWHRMVMLAPK
jgi:hypothetical protein